jgi:hypothetical protein
MKLYVEPGVVYVNGTRVIFNGGSTPLVSAPSANPRIDVLTIDNSGTLAWTVGTENASPSAPSYPADKVPLCELYNVVGETALYDNGNQIAAQGYIYNDVRPIIGLLFNPAAIQDTLLPATSGGYDLGSASFPWGNVYTNNLFVNGSAPALARFGGDGSDGALSISSGTTTLNLGAANLVVKNYTSISITGTGQLAFSNPGPNGTFIILRSQGGVTITSSTAPCIDASGMGGPGGGVGASGTAGFNLFATISPGAPGSGSSGGGATSGPGSTLLQSLFLYSRFYRLSTGAGGGGGVASTGAAGGGGAGGGALLIECGGAINFTTAGGISVAGKNGSNGTAAGNPNGGGGAGGGGAGGVCLVLYNTLTSASGTVTVSGGTGGNGGNNTATGHSGGSGGSGGNGSSGSGNGGAGGAGNTSAGLGGGGAGGAGESGLTNGTVGSNAPSNDAGGGGGGGASGYALVTKNTFFA